MITSVSSRKISMAFSTLLLIFSAEHFTLEAQTPDVPPVPRLAVAPSSYAWTIQYQYKQADPYPKTENVVDAAIYDRMRKAHPRLETIQVTKAGDNRKEVDTYADGSEEIKWFLGDIVLTDSRIFHAVSFINSKESGLNFKDDFYNLIWINKGQCKGHQSFQGTNCWVYTGKPTASSGEQTAFIDLKTGLPLAIETDDATLTYSFRSSSDAVDLPGKFATSLKRYQQALAPQQPE